MGAAGDIEVRYAAFLSRWGEYVEQGYGEVPSQRDYAEALASLVASDPKILYRGMAVHPDWAAELAEGSPLGIVWTTQRGTAASYAGAPGGGATLVDGHVPVLLKATVALSDIELDETVANFLVAGEGEVTLSEGAHIRLEAVEGLDIRPDQLGIEYPASGSWNSSPAP